MARGGKVFAFFSTVAVFILLEIAAVSLLKRSSTLQDIWINRFSHNVMAATWGGITRIGTYFSLREQNDILAGRNYELYKELQRYKEMEKAVQAMAKLDSVNFKSRFKFVPAEITAMGTNSRHNYIIIDKGSEDGVIPQSAIITPNGVVGMVYSVDRHYSYGLTLLNERVSVSARIGRNGMVAPLTWDGTGTDHAILKDIPMHLDGVLTSGISNVYPADIPLGVTQGSRLIDGSVNVVDVKLFVDFKALRYVIVAENPDREFIRKMEE